MQAISDLGIDQDRDPSDQQGPRRRRQALPRCVMGTPVRRTTRSPAGDDDHTGRPDLVRPELQPWASSSAPSLWSLYSVPPCSRTSGRLSLPTIIVVVARTVVATVAQPHSQAFVDYCGCERRSSPRPSVNSRRSRARSECSGFSAEAAGWRSATAIDEHHGRTSRPRSSPVCSRPTYQGVALLLVLGVTGLGSERDVSNVERARCRRPHHAALLELRPGRAVRRIRGHRRRSLRRTVLRAPRSVPTSPPSTHRGAH